ncbi:DUF2799 domain-containing protein [Pseudoteredinibacter isoporae]|uniref:DUF2799 domain-containing protein n=1 Tax=Pseudoteredinibacter isoporae TaxID=570281 RepID=A0A7X0MYB8_9GAMM|nr:DUF2799 domain-containing protein [Pseudoteredinibacter isoporae]MBB6522904.1 hypothetical protein [Pseudoteredinibacter isoporae]NHO88430.1 DUF2799 domain-containing protein [Pseudoteredinibacter isoporae]NIB23239.1 DUF2799 domain-containing protein [Pseudoteredinibacter isoporae]
MARILLICSVLVLASCSGLSKEECQTADWEALGFEDGVVGKSLETIGDYRESCAKHGVRIDLERYKYGRTVGLKDFCQPSSAYQAGRRGYVYKGVCPSDLEDAFVGPYEEGRTVYLAESRLRRAESDLNSAENTIDRIERDIRNREKVLLDDKTEGDKRRQIYNQIEDLKRDLYREKQKIRDLHEEVYQARRDFEDVQAQYGR